MPRPILLISDCEILSGIDCPNNFLLLPSSTKKKIAQIEHKRNQQKVYSYSMMCLQIELSRFG